MGVVILLVTVVGGFLIYFLPSFVASSRRSKNFNPVFVLNLFLGWTLLGWVIALMMAVSGEEGPTPVSIPKPPADPYLKVTRPTGLPHTNWITIPRVIIFCFVIAIIRIVAVSQSMSPSRVVATIPDPVRASLVSPREEFCKEAKEGLGNDKVIARHNEDYSKIWATKAFDYIKREAWEADLRKVAAHCTIKGTLEVFDDKTEKRRVFFNPYKGFKWSKL